MTGRSRHEPRVSRVYTSFFVIGVVAGFALGVVFQALVAR